MSSTCDICGRTFAKPFNLRRHKREVHGHISNDDNVLISTYAVLQHPFTCIVAGCTQSGKTVWVKTLLENAQKTISPPPQRIIWCYGQWQPSYFDMMKTMPGIEFNQGIPEDIDEPDYLDVSQRNLIVLDDSEPFEPSFEPSSQVPSLIMPSSSSEPFEPRFEPFEPSSEPFEPYDA